MRSALAIVATGESGLYVVRQHFGEEGGPIDPSAALVGSKSDQARSLIERLIGPMA